MNQPFSIIMQSDANFPKAYKWEIEYRSGPPGHSETEEETSLCIFVSKEGAKQDMNNRLKVLRSRTDFRHVKSAQVVEYVYNSDSGSD